MSAWILCKDLLRAQLACRLPPPLNDSIKIKIEGIAQDNSEISTANTSNTTQSTLVSAPTKTAANSRRCARLEADCIQLPTMHIKLESKSKQPIPIVDRVTRSANRQLKMISAPTETASNPRRCARLDADCIQLPTIHIKIESKSKQPIATVDSATRSANRSLKMISAPTKTTANTRRCARLEADSIQLPNIQIKIEPDVRTKATKRKRQ